MDATESRADSGSEPRCGTQSTERRTALRSPGFNGVEGPVASSTSTSLVNS